MAIEPDPEGPKAICQFPQEFLRVEAFHGKVNDREEERHAVFNNIVTENGPDRPTRIFIDQLDGEAADDPNELQSAVREPAVWRIHGGGLVDFTDKFDTDLTRP